MLDCHFPHSLSSILVSVAEQWDRETEFQVEITEQLLSLTYAINSRGKKTFC